MEYELYPGGVFLPEEELGDREDKSSGATTETSTTSSSNSNDNEEGLSAFWGKMKEKSSGIVTAYKRDLAEFGRNVREDLRAAQATANDEVSEISQSKEDGFAHRNDPVENKSISTGIISGVLGARNFFASFVAEDAAPNAALVAGSSSAVENRLAAIRSDPKSFLTDPQDPEFVEYLERFKKTVHSYTDAIAEVLADHPQAKAIHANLVPRQVTYPHFWARYFFRVAQVTMKVEKRNKLQTTAQKIVEEQSLSWGDEEEEEENGEAKDSNSLTTKKVKDELFDNEEDSKISEISPAFNNDTMLSDEESSVTETRPERTISDSVSSIESSSLGVVAGDDDGNDGDAVPSSSSSVQVKKSPAAPAGDGDEWDEWD